MASVDPSFYASVPLCTEFDRAADPAWYRPLPPQWQVGNADIVGSTAAKGRRAARRRSTSPGAAVIAGVTNALGGAEIPTSSAATARALPCRPSSPAAAAEALAAVARWAARDMDLPMRVGMVPVEACAPPASTFRSRRYAASPSVRYAMFAGGGLRWAEREIKQGVSALARRRGPRSPTSTACRATGRRSRARSAGSSRSWSSRRARTTTALRRPRRAAERAARRPRHVKSPLPAQGPPFRFPPTGSVAARARAAQVPASGPGWRLQLAAEALFSYLVLRLGIRIGGFDPERYRREIVENADFRGYDDGLRMTVDCSAIRPTASRGAAAPRARAGDRPLRHAPRRPRR